MINKILLAPAAIALMLASSAASADIVNIAATNPSNPNAAAVPVTENLAAGTYNVTVVGTAQGGAYNGWGVATPAAGNYDERYTISFGGTTIDFNPLDNQRFATALDALSAFAGNVETFTLDAASNVSFSIPDYFWSDNSGGVSVDVQSAPVTDVPEPGMMGLFGLGVASVALRRRRQAAKVAVA